MKKCILTLFYFLILFCLKAQPYQFSQSTSVYADLASPVSINGSTVWSSFQSFSVPIGFTFQFMGNNYSTIYIEGSGFCRFDANYYYLINPFTVALEDKGTSVSQSPLSYQLDGVSPSRILKIEWKNCGFSNDASGTANFQLWLYEGTNIIEVHTGSCSASAGAYSGNTNPGPAMGIYRFSSLSFCVYGIGLTGNPAAATDTEIINSNCDIFDYSLNGTPVSGNLYRFEPGSVSINEKEFTFEIYPNPAKDRIFIKNEPELIINYEIYTVTGEIIEHSTRVDENGIDLTNLPAGTYLLCLKNEENFYTITKMIKW